MSRGNHISIWRPAAVWTAVTAGALAAAGALPGAWRAVRAGSAYDRVEDLLVAGCATGLALALAWLWVITTLTVAGLAAGSPGPRPAGGVTRRLVLLACGAAIVVGSSVPAVASGGDGRDLLVGLTLPERAVAPTQARRSPQLQAPPRPPPATQTGSRPAAPASYVVRTGDSLWSIARDHPGDSGSVDQRWRAIWMANRDVVGDDPDLIFPGQALRLPPAHAPNSDGDR